MNLHTIREITYGAIFFRLFLSIVIGGILGLERGRKSRPAGLRTYILVCLGSTVVMMTNQYVSQCMNTGDPVRMGAQVLSGIGFIGAGSIMKTGRNQVRGITTAAGLWAAACIGLAIGIGFYEVAIAGGILIFIVLSIMQNMDYFTRKHTSVIDIYVELESREYMGEFIEFMRDSGLSMSNLQMEPDYLGTNSINSVAFVVTVRSLEHRPHDSMIDTLRHIPHLKFIEEL